MVIVATGCTFTTEVVTAVPQIPVVNVAQLPVHVVFVRQNQHMNTTSFRPTVQQGGEPKQGDSTYEYVVDSTEAVNGAYEAAFRQLFESLSVVDAHEQVEQLEMVDGVIEVQLLRMDVACEGLGELKLRWTWIAAAEIEVRLADAVGRPIAVHRTRNLGHYFGDANLDQAGPTRLAATEALLNTVTTFVREFHAQPGVQNWLQRRNE